MAWIEFHSSKIKRLKKFGDLRRLLSWSSNETLGFLGSFWGEAIELSEDGDITKWSPEYLCEITGTTLNPERVWNALVSTGWIDLSEDGSVLIHDWYEYAGRYLELRYRTSDPAKLNLIKEKFSQSSVSPPNLTKPNLTKREAFAPPSIEEIRLYCKERNNKVNHTSFHAFYESKGWLVGKTRMKDWRAAIRTWEQRESFQQDQRPKEARQLVPDADQSNKYLKSLGFK